MQSTLKLWSKRTVVLLASLGLLFAYSSATVIPVYASSESDICKSIGGTFTNGTCTTPGTSVDSAIGNIVNLLSIIVGIVAVIMLIIGGFRYVTSGGDANNTKNAKNTIIYALVGVVIAALAQAIVQFVLDKTV